MRADVPASVVYASPGPSRVRRRRRHGTLHAAVVSALLAATALGSCDRPTEPPAYRLSPEIYDCVVHYASPALAFRAELAFRTARDDERFELRIVEAPRLSDQWPETLPATGWERLFAGGMSEPYVFIAEPDADGKSIARAGPFAGAKAWRYVGFVADAAYGELESIIGRLADGTLGPDAAVAVADAIAAALALGSGCQELEASMPDASASGILRSGTGDGPLVVESRTALDSDGLVEARALLLRPRELSLPGGHADPRPSVTVEMSRRASAGSADIAYGEPRRGAHQRRSVRGWFPPRLDGSRSAEPLSVSACAALFGIGEIEASSLVRHSGTREALENLLAGRADLAFVVDPSFEELSSVQGATEGLSIVPIAREALVFQVHESNPVDTLGLADLRRVYGGMVQDWREFVEASHPDDPFLNDISLMAITRPVGSDAHSVFERLVLPTASIEYWESGPDGRIGSGVAYELRDEDLTTPDPVMSSGGPKTWFLGYTFHRRYTALPDAEYRLLPVDGVLPSAASIADGSYPLLFDYCVAFRAGESPPESVRHFMDWLASAEGEAAIRAAGFVPAPTARAGS